MKRIWTLLLPLLFLVGCTPPAPTDPLAALRSEKGTVVWKGEFEFVPPPAPWRLLTLDETDYSVAFFRVCSDKEPGLFPCESDFAYVEEPFGYSRDLEQRQDEFFRRFLWAARVDFEKPRLEKIRLLGSDALQAETVGRERVLKQKVLVRVLFAHRGERVVAFYFTQWRPEDRTFDRRQFEDFQAFVNSFTYLRPSFYQQL
jgi:hypothetical protein